MTHKRRFVLACICVIFLATMLVTPASANGSTNTSKIGAWYSTWYAKNEFTNEIWATSFGTNATPFVGDVNGDGKEDAVAYSDGTWQVALSNGTAFTSPSDWIQGHGVGSTKQALADVNGDGKADAIVAFNADVNQDGEVGDWYVSLSNGTSFLSYSLWKSGFSPEGTILIADVNGDGKEDLSAIDNSVWKVCLAENAQFGDESSFMTNIADNIENFFATDINADGKADAVVYSNGIWTYYLSNGSYFYGPGEILTTGHGVGATFRFADDANGDGFGDPIVYFNADVNGDGLPGDVYGRATRNFSISLNVAEQVLNTGFGYDSNAMFLANVDDNFDGYKHMVCFYASTGTWKVQEYRAAKPNLHDTWDAWGISYIPKVGNQYRQYDSSETAVIQEHLQMCEDAQIDFLLLDETNHLFVDDYYIYNRACKVVDEISLWNQNSANRTVQYAIAIGGVQWSHNPAEIEEEAAAVWERFVQEYGSGNYFEVDGKPLLVVYCIPEDEAAWRAWSGDKTASNHFTMRFAHSPTQKGNYGWEVRTGTIPDDEVMVVMPGWDNGLGVTPVLRNHGTYYSESGWEVVLEQDVLPEIVLINSFNEYAEETAIAPADTSMLAANMQWRDENGVLDNELYWDMTVEYIQRLKQIQP